MVKGGNELRSLGRVVHLSPRRYASTEKEKAIAAKDKVKVSLYIYT